MLFLKKVRGVFNFKEIYIYMYIYILGKINILFKLCISSIHIPFKLRMIDKSTFIFAYGIIFVAINFVLRAGYTKYDRKNLYVSRKLWVLHLLIHRVVLVEY